MNVISQLNNFNDKLINYVDNKKNKKLNKFCLLEDSNFHKNNIVSIPNTSKFPILSESLFPQIRTIATLIAYSRFNFNEPSPSIFTEEADWFAARIIVLQVKFFFLEIKLYPIIKIANDRAKEFSLKHNLDFTEAKVRLCFNKKANLLIFETNLPNDLPNNLNNTDFLFNSNLINLKLKNIIIL